MSKRRYLDEITDWDPDNPYHYHTKTGEKIVITPEDWEKHKGKSYFKQVEDAVLAEQAAYSNPEYIINPKFVDDLANIYKNNLGSKYQNYSSFSSSLPEGYSFTKDGLIKDKQGNLYVQKGFRQSSRFTYDNSNPLTFSLKDRNVNKGDVTFYPINMEKNIKPAVPVNSVMNVDELRESAIENYNPRMYKAPIGYMTMQQEQNPNVSYFLLNDGNVGGWVLDYMNNTKNESDNHIRQNNTHLNRLLTAKEYNDAARKINNKMQKEASNDASGSKYDYIEYVHPSRKEAERKAVIEVEPLIYNGILHNKYKLGGKLNNIRKHLYTYHV